MVPATRWQEAFEAVRRLMLDQHHGQLSAVQVRWQQRDDADLSAQNGRDTVSLALASRGAGAHRFLRAVHTALLPFDPRPHWGKMHYFGAADVERAYPQLAHFRQVRAAYDPAGVFLNEYFEELLLHTP
jgi:FAD/FMN-containing dehydrogenase